MEMRGTTRAIVRRGKEYLVGTRLYGSDLQWSIYLWDAWQTRSLRNARIMAEKVGGVPVLFNPITGDTEEVRHLDKTIG